MCELLNKYFELYIEYICFIMFYYVIYNCLIIEQNKSNFINIFLYTLKYFDENERDEYNRCEFSVERFHSKWKKNWAENE